MSNENKKSSKKNNIVKAVGLGLIILILSGGVAFMSNLSDGPDYKINDDDKRTLGNDLDDTGWMLFVQEGCPACDMQKRVLGNEISGLKIVDCAASSEDGMLCAQENIKVIPTWVNVFSGETIAGVQQIEQLEELCK